MNKLLLACAAFSLLLSPAEAQRSRRVVPAQADPPGLNTIADQVSEAALRATVERLVSFGTRHTLSSRDHPTRGIGAALTWAEQEFGRYARACGGCLEVRRIGETVTRPPQARA